MVRTGLAMLTLLGCRISALLPCKACARRVRAARRMARLGPQLACPVCMLYRAYQTNADLLSPSRLASQYLGSALWRPDSDRSLTRRIAAAMEVYSRMRLTHTRPAYGIDSVMVDGQEVAVHEEAALT